MAFSLLGRQSLICSQCEFSSHKLFYYNHTSNSDNFIDRIILMCEALIKSVLFISAPDYSGLEGAVGFTPPTEDSIPEWDDPREEQHEDELHEVRKRRLQKFSSESIESTKVKTEVD